MKTLAKGPIFDRVTALLLPIAFVGPGFLNMWAFVLDGHRHGWFRQSLVLGVEGIAAICFFVKVCLLFRSRKDLRRPILVTALVPVLFGIIYAWGLLTGTDRSVLLKETVINGAYLVSACCAVVIVAAEKCLTGFLKTCRNYALILSPVVLYYCIRFYLPSAEYGVENLGVLSYMPLAYCLMEFCIFLLLKPLWAHAEGNGTAFPKAEFALYTLFSVAITLSGTKGTILCLLWGGSVTFVYAMVVRRGRKQFACFAASALLCVVLFTTVFAPGMQNKNRVTAFVDELFAQETTDISPEPIEKSREILRRFGYSEKGFAVVEFFSGDGADAALAAGELTQEEYDLLEGLYEKLQHTATGGRKMLWLQALDEIKAAPLTGQGPFFYQMKYGTYPHNFFLELATDFGVPATLLVLALGLYVFGRLIAAWRGNPVAGVGALYVLTYVPQKMLSGSLYDYTVFFQYGLCLVFLFLFRQDLCKKETGGKL